MDDGKGLAGGFGPASGENKALLARIAWLYYHRGMTQQAVADQLGLSRNKVLRLLARARDEGVVQIRVVHPSIRHMELEARLVDAFGLREAVVAPTGDSEEKTLEAIGQFGAMYLERTLRSGDVIGTAWGVALREVARHLRPLELGDVTVVQLMGGLHADGLVNPLDVARVMAEKLGGQARMLYTPAFVDTSEIREALLSDQRIAQTLRAGAAVGTALVGIGDVSNANSLIRWRALSADELEGVVARGAVGDILGRHFDADGRPVESALSNRVVAVSLETVREIPNVVAVAAGQRKAAAVLGALRGRYVDVLVTDEAAARAVLELHGIETAGIPGGGPDAGSRATPGAGDDPSRDASRSGGVSQGGGVSESRDRDMSRSGGVSESGGEGGGRGASWGDGASESGGEGAGEGVSGRGGAMQRRG